MIFLLSCLGSEAMPSVVANADAKCDTHIARTHYFATHIKLTVTGFMDTEIPLVKPPLSLLPSWETPCVTGEGPGTSAPDTLGSQGTTEILGK